MRETLQVFLSHILPLFYYAYLESELSYTAKCQLV